MIYLPNPAGKQGSQHQGVLGPVTDGKPRPSTEWVLGLGVPDLPRSTDMGGAVLCGPTGHPGSPHLLSVTFFWPLPQAL